MSDAIWFCWSHDSDVNSGRTPHSKLTRTLHILILLRQVFHIRLNRVKASSSEDTIPEYTESSSSNSVSNMLSSSSAEEASSSNRMGSFESFLEDFSFSDTFSSSS